MQRRCAFVLVVVLLLSRLVGRLDLELLEYLLAVRIVFEVLGQ